MTSPHDARFPYRRHILAVVLVGAVVAALLDPSSRRGDRIPDALFVCVASLGAYAVMRLLMVLIRTLPAVSPRLLHNWGPAWFYGAVPVSLVGLYVGSYKLHAPTPNLATVALVVAVAAAMAAAAFGVVAKDRPNQRLERLDVK